MPSYEFHALSDPGRVRTNNEDAVAIHEDVALMLLADGMGGYNAGEVAAGMAVEHVGSEMQRWLRAEGAAAAGADVRAMLEASVQQANHAILGAALMHGEYNGMGTTLVVGVLHAGRLILAHIGDSRGYRLRAGRLQQLTRDHSWLQEQVDAGLLTPAQAARSGQRNLVTRALGVEGRAQLEVNEFAIEPGDLYLLCSDGLTDLMHEDALAELAGQRLPLPEKARRLVERANALGGRDNISVVLAQVGGEPPLGTRRAGLMARLLRGAAPL